jgi:hypothetical protein
MMVTDDHDSIQGMIDDSMAVEKAMLEAIRPVVKGKDGRIVLAGLFGLTAAFGKALGVPGDAYEDMAAAMAGAYVQTASELPAANDA